MSLMLLASGHFYVIDLGAGKVREVPSFNLAGDCYRAVRRPP